MKKEEERGGERKVGEILMEKLTVRGKEWSVTKRKCYRRLEKSYRKGDINGKERKKGR